MASDNSISRIFPSNAIGALASSSTWSRIPMSSLKVAVETFDGTGHFGMWQGEVMDSLFQQGLDIAIEEKKSDDIEEKEWSTINRLACGTIRSCLSKEQKYAFKNETSAWKLWKALEGKFLKKSGQNKLLMKKILFRFDYQPGTTMNEHITIFNQLVADLLNLDVNFEDEDLALMLLSSLPDEFEHLETTLLHGKENVSLDAVCSALYSRELRKQDKKKKKVAAADEALVARGRQQSQSKGRRGWSKSISRVAKDECAFCREKGHWKKDCPKLKKKGKAPQDVNVAECKSDAESDFSLAVSRLTSHPDEWILDSTCTYHMTPMREWFFEFEELDGGFVYMGNDNPCKTVGIGSIKLRNHDGSTRILKDVRYVPNLKRSLISLGLLESKGLEVRMRDGILKVTSGALLMLKGVRKNNLYYYQGSTVVGTAAVATSSSSKKDAEATKLWHMRLGDAGEKSLQNLAKQGLLKGTKVCKLEFCEHCVLEKQRKVKFGTGIHNTKGILDYVHSDVWGPAKTPSLGGRYYFVTFIDDFSRRVWVFTMKSKDEMLKIFLKWKARVENQTGRKIKILRTDNGGEYKSDPFQKICQECGIVRHFIVRKIPQQNGVSEHMNKTLVEKVRCMLSNAGLGRKFWAEAVTYAQHLVNRLPSSAIGGKTPLEVWSGKLATDYDSLRIFDSTAYYHVNESKLDPRAKKALFMGFSAGVKGYRLWYLEAKKTIISRDVTFDESVMLNKITQDGTSGTPQQVECTPKQVEFEQIVVSPANSTISDSPMAEEESDEEEVSTQEPQQQQKSIAVNRAR
ncbi:unnamed protein product [Coffea canephora]|uniref:Integrase catalytic domain-containing protein n=1 Tax=Coffea canephora TaxID=49390 RepID=A0A068VDJ5_COFCA|nr:unnamed protein product [Coffea canephora]